MRLVLASTSGARRALLEQVGLVFEAIAPGIAEPLQPGLEPAEQVEVLAEAKARAVAALAPDAVVIGADQLLVLGGEPFGKPADEAAALAQLRRLSGRAHELATGLCILAPGRAPVREHEVTRLWVRPLSEAELLSYVATGEWHGCAGSYRIEGRGLALMERIEGDHENILGLPMLRLLRHLRRLGISLP